MAVSTNEASKWFFTAVIFAHLLALVIGTGVDEDGNLKFFLDSKTDCTAPARYVYGKASRIMGQGGSGTQQPVTYCSFTLREENNFQKSVFRVEVVAMNIINCDVKLYIYNGLTKGDLLKSFACNQVSPKEYFTSGDSISFVLERKNVQNTKYDIELIVTPLISGLIPNPDNGNNNDQGFYKRTFPTEAILGIVGGAFLLVVIIIIIVVIVCHRKIKGTDVPSKEYKLGFINTGASFEPKNGAVSDVHSEKAWANDSSRGSRAHDPPRSRMPRPSEDVDSVFDDADYPPKRRSVAENSLQRTANGRYSYRKNKDYTRPEDFKRRDDVRKRDDFKRRNLDNSFVQADDDHPQDVYVERIIEPRVRTKPRRYEPDPVEYDETSDNEKSVMEDEGIQCEDDEDEEKKEETESEEEETEEEEEETEEEEEETEDEEEDGKEKEAGDRPVISQSDATQPVSSAHPQTLPRHVLPRTQGYPMQAMHPPPYTPQYVVYPGAPRPQQFVAVPAGPTQFQPIHAAPSMPPPRYPGLANRDPRRVTPGVKPTDPPIYSYLVQRGYTPLDGRISPASTNASNHSDNRILHTNESDLSAPNLESGVEFMRR